MNRKVLSIQFSASSQPPPAQEGASPYLIGKGMVTDSRGTLWRSIHDQEQKPDSRPRMLRPGYGYKKAVPETRIAFNNTEGLTEFVPLTRDLQFLWYEMMQVSLAPFNVPDGEPFRWFKWVSTPRKPKGEKIECKRTDEGAMPDYPLDTIKGCWQWITEDHRALTDKNATKNGFRDFILGVNPNAPPMRQKRLSFGGAVHYGIDYAAGDNAYIRQHYHAVEALNGRKPVPKLEWILREKPHWIMQCTECTPNQLPDGRYVVSWWPPMKHWGVGTPALFLSNTDRNYILKTDSVRIGNGIKWSSYVPEK